MSTNDGGPAFPRPFSTSNGALVEHQIFVEAENGMTLRDYFAAKAMASIVAGDGARMVAERDGRYDETNWAQVVASNAYAFADAMLAERVRPMPPLLDSPTT